MKILLLLISFSSFAQYDYINPYVRKDGTYVKGHVKTAPNGIKQDNLGYQRVQQRRMKKRLKVRRFQNNNKRPTWKSY